MGAPRPNQHTVTRSGLKTCSAVRWKEARGEFNRYKDSIFMLRPLAGQINPRICLSIAQRKNL